MSLPTIFASCEPREDVLRGTIQESDFAADLAQVLRGDAPKEYSEPGKFFANTHPTRGLKDLLRNVCLRLSGSGEQVASIFRLDTQYGGGKTHALIALVHAANGMKGVDNTQEFIDPAALPKGRVRIAAFDGENADPANGRQLEKGLRAFTPWGELAYALAGKEGYERVRRSDEEGMAPGAETLRELFGGEPTLILMDELSIYLRKLKAGERNRTGGQLTAFLTALFKAVEGTTNAAVVFTLAIGKDSKSVDAYSEENQFIADKMAEAESVSARKATLLNPTEEDETVKVLQRRLFQSVDEAKAEQIVAAYKALWDANREFLPAGIVKPETLAAFQSGFPLHPELIATLTNKTSTLANFQRVRGMLRLLARTIAHLWDQRLKDTHALHLHHVDPGQEAIRQEIVTRLGQRQYVPAIRNDVAAIEGDKTALAQELDAEFYKGLPPYASFVARTVFLHTLAFNDSLKGVSSEEMRYSTLAPGMDISFIDDARKRFMAGSAYLDDRHGVPLRFLAEANLTQMIRRQEQQVDPGEVRTELKDRIKKTFSDATFSLIPFASGPHEVPDESGDSKPLLVLLSYDACSVSGEAVEVPELVERIYKYKGVSNDVRKARNNLVFIIADEGRKEEMRRNVVRRLALLEMRRPERLGELAEHQRDRVNELYQRAEQEIAVAIQQCYRHLFYPSKNRVDGANVDLAHSASEVQSASEKPGIGQQQVIRTLKDNNKLRMATDTPDNPTYVRDRTPLKKGQMTTLALRTEFRLDPALPILVGNDIFVKGIRQGIEQGEFVYKSGELLYGKGDPFAEIKIDEQSVVYTIAYAKEQSIWPRPEKQPEKPDSAPGKSSTEGDGAATDKAGKSDPAPAIAGSGARAGGGSTAAETAPLTKSSNTFKAEGVLKEALTQIWEQARAKKFSALSQLTMRLFDPADAFRILGAVNAITGAEKTVTIAGDYVTAEGGEMSLEYRGPVADAQPVKEFLDPQLRAAKEKNLETRFEIRFPDGGLSLAGDACEKMADRLARFATGAAYIEATAEAKS